MKINGGWRFYHGEKLKSGDIIEAPFESIVYFEVTKIDHKRRELIARELVDRRYGIQQCTNIYQMIYEKYWAYRVLNNEESELVRTLWS